jgi:hypothetical protein
MGWLCFSIYFFGLDDIASSKKVSRQFLIFILTLAKFVVHEIWLPGPVVIAASKDSRLRYGWLRRNQP